MKKLFRLKHPKLLILLIAIIISYYIFQQPIVSNFVMNLGNYGYLSTFIAGIFFALGFTTPLAVGFFLKAHISNIFLSAVIASLGSTIATISLFHWFKFSFEDEIEDLERTKDFRRFMKLIDEEIPHKIRVYLAYAFIGLILASPIPNEFGTFMLAGLKKINHEALIILTFAAGTFGIYIIMLLAH